MNGTRFMVIKLRELVKTAIFAILGIIIIIGLIYFFLPKAQQNALYEPGTYNAEVNLNGQTAQVEVSVSKSAIKSIELTQVSEAMPVFYPLAESTAEELAAEIVKKQSLDVTASSHNTYTAELLLDAVARGLEQAKIK